MSEMRNPLQRAKGLGSSKSGCLIGELNALLRSRCCC